MSQLVWEEHLFSSAFPVASMKKQTVLEKESLTMFADQLRRSIRSSLWKALTSCHAVCQPVPPLLDTTIAQHLQKSKNKNERKTFQIFVEFNGRQDTFH